jgi:arginine/serine-rich splicing factor 12
LEKINVIFDLLDLAMAGGSSATRVVQITNIAPQATKDQMQNLFGHIGK